MIMLAEFENCDDLIRREGKTRREKAREEKYNEESNVLILEKVELS
jgi:hypothetical protein